MGVTPPPEDAAYGALVRECMTPVGFITNYDESRSYLCGHRTSLVVPTAWDAADTQYCASYWDSAQALRAWATYLGRPPASLAAEPAGPVEVVDGIREGLNGWVQGEASLAQVRPTP